MLCTAPAEVAPTLARQLLEARLIACANLLPGARALYWWEGELQDEEEVLMLMETPSERAAEAIAALEQAHPYEVPKILGLDPHAVNGPYLEWLRTVTRASAG
nr:divalent-cation tolerance protein CutA [Pseudenhygromyxa sp. WMMC2535]